MVKRYTEGIAGDGAAILDNGVQITITEILNRLNKLDEIEQLMLGGVVRRREELLNRCSFCGRTDKERLMITNMCMALACPY